MANLKHVVSDLHGVYLTEMEAKIKPQMGKDAPASSSSAGGEKKEAGGGGESDNIQKSARQLAYDTRYKARREGIPLERAFSQAVQNSSASAPVKDAAKSMLFRSTKAEDVETEGSSIQEVRKGDKEMVRVTPKKGYGDQKGYVRFASGTKKKELRDNPQIQSVTPTSHGEPYEGKYKVKDGEKKNTKGDLDGDGTKEPDKHEYAGVKDKAIKAAMKKKSKSQPKESMSNWKTELGIQEDLVVEAGDSKDKKISEKSVKNKVTINPELKEAIAQIGGEVLEVDELTQEQVEQILKDGLAENLATLKELGIDVKSIVDEAVYGGTPAKKEAPKDNRMVVTNADKKANTPAYQNFKKGDKRYKSADHMDEENVDELYKGKHGQSEKQYQDGRSDAGKMVSGDSKGSGANYSYRAKNTGSNPAGGSKKPQGQARMSMKDRAYLAYQKANSKK
jgi:hypothetical protein